MPEPRVNHKRAALALVLLVAAAPARETLGVFHDWAAFREPASDRCFAMAEPPPGTSAFGLGAVASVAAFPAQRIRAQLSVRLSRGHQPAAPVTLSIGDSGFRLVVAAGRAWAADRRADAAIVAAMRSGSSMSVSTVAEDGRAYADVYRLRGAASAIDAAMLACPPGR
ncbi:invasion associated locus B family protein [Sphingomonas morindae]|uniref:Uncharacterized protein n=1 Tax=Sphingomonas morindae TaxID=1541170 RepID=A0ABY4XBC1_9SPHN|nr:invasion associated locus B family protein [Sphingomonas morindae]USI74213.1 hypothetical protein LHA26_07105 [Sphingomonas morindae]